MTSARPDESPRAEAPKARTAASPARVWWNVGVPAVVVVLGSLVTAGVLSSRTASIQELDTRQTHTVRRGNLLVTITEQGTLESSRNREIKCEIRGGYGGRGGQSMVTWVIPSGSFVEKGDELVRLDTKIIEETISLGKTDTNIATAALARAEADVAIATTAIDAYLNGTFRTQMQTLQSQLEIAEWNRDTAEKLLRESKTLHRKGFVTQSEVQANEYTVTQAKLEVDSCKTEIDVLERLTKAMRMETLNGQLEATKARLKGRRAGVKLEQGRLDLANEEFEKCVIRAPADGLVIYPSTAKWKNTPDITEGASVHNNQVLLLMPDLDRMQLKVGIHESIIDQVKPGMPAKVSLPNRMLDTTVSSVASVASPSGWWSGNMVRYDTAIELPSDEGLNPGMSALVEITLARHDDVLMIPIAAVVETAQEAFCWVETGTGIERRSLKLGDSNDEFLVVTEGVEEWDEVVVDPVDVVPEARRLVAPTLVHKVERGELLVSLTEQGTLESSNNTLVKCRVRGSSTVNWVIESGAEVKEGDKLVRLENKQIQEHIHERTKFAHLSRDAAIGFRAQATVAGLAISEYVEGRYRTQLIGLEKQLAVALQNLQSAEDLLEYTRLLQQRGYRSELDVEQQQSNFQQARLAAEIKQIEIDVLKKFTKKEELESLKGNWEASRAEANGHEEVLKADEARIAHALEELSRCTINAPRDGLVIYPKGKEWKDEPEISQGSTVHSDQVLLLMPDLSNMQVRVGIHEGMVDQVKPGMKATVTLPNRVLEGEVTSVASTAEPGGWWTGNIVKYDALIRLPSVEGLKPGMTAEVEITIARHQDVLRIPLAAVIETESGDYCWVGTPERAQKRRVELSSSNEAFVIVKEGVDEGDSVVLNAATWFAEAQELSAGESSFE